MTEGTCNAGLVAVTVTPGRTAPVLSVTTPDDAGGICGPLAGHRGHGQRKQADEHEHADNQRAESERALHINMCPSSSGLPGRKHFGNDDVTLIMAARRYEDER